METQLNICTREISAPPNPLALFQASVGSDFRAFWRSSQSGDFLEDKKGVTLFARGEAFSCGLDLESLNLESLNFPPDTIFIGGAAFQATSAFQSTSSFQSKDAAQSTSAIQSTSSFQSTSALQSNQDILPEWKNFPSSKLILPRLLLICSESDAETAQLQIAAEDNIHADVIFEEYEELLAKSKNVCSTGADLPFPASTFYPSPSKESSLQEFQISDAIKEISKSSKDLKKSGLKKVVLAKCQSYSFIDNVADNTADNIIAKLADKYPSCAIFAFDFIKAGKAETFFGATPEILIKIQAEKLETAALAGSTSSNLNPAGDREFSNNPKERAEHQFVVDELVQKLSGMDIELNPISSSPEIRKLPDIQHLQTSITGKLTAPVHILDCVKILTPTPAVAGIPTKTALKFISATETFNRGWYSGPVGWCRLKGEGEFYVALRAALMESSAENSQLHIFAGAGIVADSDPTQELAEIELKLDSIRTLLTLDEGT